MEAGGTSEVTPRLTMKPSSSECCDASAQSRRAALHRTSANTDSSMCRRIHSTPGTPALAMITLQM
jgi:hypothetical protein